MTDQPFHGVANATVTESEPWWPNADTADRPNVLLIVLDDTGWSDLGCFGSEIATPAIDRLAADGLRYVNFHATPLCSPTRASLLTGRNHHRVGMGFLAAADMGFPGRRGRVTRHAANLAEVLRPEGYATFLSGKWHLTPSHETTSAGPFDSWPLARGFDRFYGFLHGCTDQFHPELVEDNHQVEPPARADYHLSEDLADHAISYLEDHVAFGGGRPFFLQLAFGATHAPFQAPRRFIDKYDGVFDKGWDQIRVDRLQRQKELGLVPPDTDLTTRDEGVPAWDSLDAGEQRLYSRLQAAFAGFLEHTDTQIARVVAALDDLDHLSNTIVLVLSDNGASPEGEQTGGVNVMGPYNGVQRPISEELADIDRIGGPDGPSHYPMGWAMAGNTPFRKYKQFVDLGGVRSPLVLHWPDGFERGGEVRHQFAHVIDVVPTVLQLLDVPFPVTIGGFEQLTLDGASIADTIAAPLAPAARSTQYWEMFGHRAIWHDGWKAVTNHRSGESYSDESWRLYRTEGDFSEAHDLAATHPEKLAELRTLWHEEAARNHVYPLDDRAFEDMLVASTPGSVLAADRYVLNARHSHVPSSTGLTGTDRSLRITAELTRTGHDEGVIVSSGGQTGGYVLYVRDRLLHFEHLFLGARDHVRSAVEVPLGACRVSLELVRNLDGSARATMHLDGDPIGEGSVHRVARELSFWGLDVGRDAVSRVSDAYSGEFAFAETALGAVTIEFIGDEAPAEVARTELGLQ